MDTCSYKVPRQWQPIIMAQNSQSSIGYVMVVVAVKMQSDLYAVTLESQPLYTLTYNVIKCPKI